jgi:hypothetical protein
MNSYSRLIPIAAIVLTACNASDSQNPAAPPGTGIVRIVQADPTAGNIDVTIDQTKAVSNLAFAGDTSIPAVASGEHTVTAYAAGTTTNPLASATVQISNGIHYDFIVSGGTAGGVQLLGGVSEPGGNHLASYAALRLFDGIDPTDIGNGNLGTVNVTLTGTNPNNAYSFSGLTQFGSAPANPQGLIGYAEIAPDTYQVVVTDTTGAITAVTGNVTFTAGQLRTIVFTSSPPPPGTPPGMSILIPDQH